MFKKLSRVFAIIGLGGIIVFAASGCSVFMAANEGGPEVPEILRCQTISCLEAKGAKHIRDGEDHIQYYKLKKTKASPTRATMHGVLDVFTCGLWEIAGTPIEAAIDKEKYYVLKVRTGEKGIKIKNIQVSR